MAIVGGQTKYLPERFETDHYGRRRTVSPNKVFSTTFAYNSDPIQFDRKLVTGGTITHSPNNSSVHLNVTASNGSEVIFQTRNHFRYMPGATDILDASCFFGASEAGLIKQYGLFNGQDGAYFEQTSEGMFVCITSNATGTPTVTHRIAQVNWNIDTMDGTGPSGLTFDPEDYNIFIIEYTWQGAGPVRYGLYTSKGIKYFHEITFNGITNPIWGMPNLPIRARIVRTSAGSGAAAFRIGSVAIYRDTDTIDFPQFDFGASRLESSVSISSGTFKPVISVRPKLTFGGRANRVLIEPVKATILNIQSRAMIYQIVKGGTLTSPTWVSAGANSAAEYDISATGLSGGDIIQEGYVGISGFQEITSVIEAKNAQVSLDIDGSNPQVLTLNVRSFANNTDTYGSIDWKEIY